MALPGAAYSTAGLEDARIALVRHCRNDGYLYARIFADVAFSEDRLAADLTFRFEEGPQVRIANIVIRGNRHTEERIIESRMSLKPGDLYRLEQALQDQRNIASLGVFSSVRVRLIDEEAPAERKDVVAEVAERNRQSIEIWPGLSTADGPRLRLDYAHLNILGTASTFNLSLKVNWKLFFGFYGEYADVLRKRYDHFTLRERTEAEARAGIRTRLFTLPLEPAARFDLVGERDNAIPYSLDALRAIFGLDVPLARAATMALEPQFSLTNLRCYPSTPGGAGTDCEGDLLGATRERRRIDKGLRAEFKVGPSFTYDGRDDALSPRKGVFANARAVWAKGATLPPGSDLGARIDGDDWRPFSFTKLEATLSGYIPLGAAASLGLTARVGSIVRGDAPIDERFYLGGSNSLRGFQEDALLAQDHCVRWRRDIPARPSCTETEQVESKAGGFTPPVTQGGNQLAVVKSEVRLGIAEKTLLVVFVDAGNLWLVRPALGRVVFRINPGLGLRYTTPAGPIGLDLGVNTDPNPLKGERWFSAQFAVGTF